MWRKVSIVSWTSSVRTGRKFREQNASETCFHTAGRPENSDSATPPDRSNPATRLNEPDGATRRHVLPTFPYGTMVAKGGGRQ